MSLPARPVFPAYATLLDKMGWYALRGVGVLVLLFLLLPILVIMPLSFSSSSFLSYPMPGWSLQWYDNLFSSEEWARATRNSFIVAPLATILANPERFKGRRVGVIITGGNVDLDSLPWMK